MSTTSSFQSNADGTRITTYTWAETPGQPVGVVQISHGLAEHGERYDRFARALNAAGFIVHAVDHRGHGRTAGDNLGDFGSAGFSGLIADVAQFGALLRAQHGPQLPLFLFGHSMGSFAAQAAIIDHSSTWSGVILSGSTALDLFAAAMANAPADAPAGLAAFNAGFEHRTGYEWLSRDAAEVDAYVADPWCGWDVPPDVIPHSSPPRRGWPTPHNSRASAATCPSSSHPATQTRWPQAGCCWSNWGSGIAMPVWPMWRSSCTRPRGMRS